MKNNSLKNFGFRRKSGVLMPISSLPSPYGIGSFGKGSFDFVDFLEETKTKCWQVLPLNPTSYGDSPYQSPAALAGNPYFIDLEILAKKKLVSKEDLKGNVHNTKKVDYGWLFNNRYPLLRKAYESFKALSLDKSDEYRSFVKKNSSWLEDYSLFMALKVHYGYREWTAWNDEHKDVRLARLEQRKFESECGFWKWVQFEFDAQWKALVDYAHSKGIVIIGDMPIYVAHDSMDVWRAPDQFLIDDEYKPIIVAGCPPDAFSDDGQLWGNPIYNWQRMDIDGFSWWKKRVEYAFRLYDILRIDHFRGFASYYAIPYGDENAKRGNWMKAPGVRLFEAIKDAQPNAKIIAEDLGFITEDVRELLTKTEFPGMKILHFAFSNEDNEYLPRMYNNENCVAYTGSHDSECTKSWYKNLSSDERRRFKKECPVAKGENPTDALIALIMSSRANLVVIPMQDYLHLTSEKGRMNTPSLAEGNWQWRAKRGYCSESVCKKIHAFAKKARRLK